MRFCVDAYGATVGVNPTCLTVSKYICTKFDLVYVLLFILNTQRVSDLDFDQI